MSKQLNATCVLCGKKYHRCDTCEKMKNTFASWRILTDSIEHFKLFDLLRDYGLGKVKKNDFGHDLLRFPCRIIFFCITLPYLKMHNHNTIP